VNAPDEGYEGSDVFLVSEGGVEDAVIQLVPGQLATTILRATLPSYRIPSSRAKTRPDWSGTNAFLAGVIHRTLRGDRPSHRVVDPTRGVNLFTRRFVDRTRRLHRRTRPAKSSTHRVDHLPRGIARSSQRVHHRITRGNCCIVRGNRCIRRLHPTTPRDDRRTRWDKSPTRRVIQCTSRDKSPTRRVIQCTSRDESPTRKVIVIAPRSRLRIRNESAPLQEIVRRDRLRGCHRQRARDAPTARRWSPRGRSFARNVCARAQKGSRAPGMEHLAASEDLFTRESSRAGRACATRRRS
jgi:hypothetical protein